MNREDIIKKRKPPMKQAALKLLKEISGLDHYWFIVKKGISAKSRHV